MTLAAYEAEAREFVEAIGREHYLNGAGLKPTLAIAPLFARYRHLFARPAVETALAWRSDRRGAHLARFAATGYLEIGRAHV